MGAIHGFDFRGFFGEVYRIYPFPQEPEDFKQNPEGFRTRSVMEQVLAKYGSTVAIPIRFPAERNEVVIGDYRFNQEIFPGIASIRLAGRLSSLAPRLEARLRGDNEGIGGKCGWFSLHRDQGKMIGCG